MKPVYTDSKAATSFDVYLAGFFIEEDFDISSMCLRISSARLRISGSFMVGLSAQPDIRRIISDMRFIFVDISLRMSAGMSPLLICSCIRDISCTMSFMIPAMA